MNEVEYTVGDRVKVIRVARSEPGLDTGVLIGQVGTVVDPAVDDEDSQGNSTFRVAVTLDERVDLGGYPTHLACEFVFDTAELEAVQK